MSPRNAKAGQAPSALDTKQERSRRTLERILEAAEELLQERDFDELTMADLAARAGCGVGTLYGRIPNKESLVACLYQRQQSIAGDGVLRAQQREASLEERVHAICAMVVDHCVAHKGTIRATTGHLFRRPEGDVYGFRREITAATKQLAAFLAEKADGVPLESRQSHCEFALLAAFDVAQSRVVFGDRSAIRLTYSRKELKARLATLVLAYLGACSS